MTDGSQRVVGMEYRPIRGLEVLAPAGLKVNLRLNFYCFMNQDINQFLVLCYKPTTKGN